MTAPRRTRTDPEAQLRHLGSLLLALVFAPAIFLLTGSGLSAFQSTVEIGAVHRPLGALTALGAFAVAGALYAILTMARISPIGPVLAGLAWLATAAWVLIDTASYDATFAMLNIHMAGAAGRSGLLFLLSPPLIATVFSGRRWRRHPERSAPPLVPAMVAPVPQSYPPAPGPMPAGHGQVGAPSPTQFMTAPMPPDLASALPDVPAPSLHYPKVAVAPVPPAATVKLPSTPGAPNRSADATVKLTPPQAPNPPADATVKLTPPQAPNPPADATVKLTPPQNPGPQTSAPQAEAPKAVQTATATATAAATAAPEDLVPPLPRRTPPQGGKPAIAAAAEALPATVADQPSAAGQPSAPDQPSAADLSILAEEKTIKIGGGGAEARGASETPDEKTVLLRGPQDEATVRIDPDDPEATARL